VSNVSHLSVSCLLLSHRLGLSSVMDPLSVTASAITVIELTTQLIKATRKYYNNVSNAPREIAEFIDQLNILGGVLERLKHTSLRADATLQSQITTNGGAQSSQVASRLPLLRKMLEVDGPLAICYGEMVAFQKKLGRNQSRIKRSLKWPFEKDEIGGVVARLRNLKSILDTAIISDQL